MVDTHEIDRTKCLKWFQDKVFGPCGEHRAPESTLIERLGFIHRCMEPGRWPTYTDWEAGDRYMECYAGENGYHLDDDREFVVDDLLFEADDLLAEKLKDATWAHEFELSLYDRGWIGD